MTQRINISGIIFNVEPIGYEILRAYLGSWNQMNLESKAQWEEQAAEYLLQKLGGGTSVTTTSHVEGIIVISPEKCWRPN